MVVHTCRCLRAQVTYEAALSRPAFLAADRNASAVQGDEYAELRSFEIGEFECRAQRIGGAAAAASLYHLYGR